MQGKRVHIDDKFTDRAWSEMNLLLDKELPVLPQKHRRVIAWWWVWLLGIGMVAGAVVFVSSIKMKDSKAPDNMPVASVNAVTSKVIAPAKIESENAEKITVQANSKVSNDILNNGKNKGVRQDLRQNSKVRPKEKNNIKTTKNNSESKNSIVENEMLSDDVGLNTSKQENIGAGSNNRTPIVADYLASSSLEPIIVANKNQFGVPEILSRKRWNWGVEISALSNLKLSGSGISAELIAMKPLKNTRFNFDIGAGYAMFFQPIDFYRVTPEQVLTADDLNAGIAYQSADKVTFESLDPNIGVYKNSQSLKLHYLFIPIQLSYRLTSRISLETGITSRILLFSKSNYTNGGIVDDFVNTSKRASNLPNTKISFYDFSVNGGIAFNVSHKLGLHLDYLHGITDVLPDNSVGDYNRLLKLGIRYNLSRGY